MKKPTKKELYNIIEEQKAENKRLKDAAAAAVRQEWERKRPEATEYFLKYINGIFPGMVCKVTLEHIDASGYWFTFELKNDPRRQTYAIRHTDLL